MSSGTGFLNFFLPIPLATLPLIFAAPPLELKQNRQLHRLPDPGPKKFFNNDKFVNNGKILLH